MKALERLLADSQEPKAATPRIQPLLEYVQKKYGDQVQAILLYGSCKQQETIGDGLVDLCVIVDDYQKSFDRAFDRIANHCLPPNVYYVRAGNLHSKYIVISKDDLQRKMCSRWDHYFWARFSQPFIVLYTQTEVVAAWLVDIQRQALTTFFTHLLAVQRNPTKPLEFWSDGLRRTYACELRPESPSHASYLVEQSAEFWTLVTAELIQQQNIQQIGSHQAKVFWRIRKVTGKLLNLMRLLKAGSTFAGGLDYVAWKVERHSGIPVHITDRMRRYPRWSAWKLGWQLLRTGAVR